MSKEDKKGWLASILVHLILGMLFFFWTVEVTRTEPEFLEVSWGRFSNVPINPAPASPPSSVGSKTQQKPAVRNVPVDLPERTPGIIDEDPPLPVTRKSLVDEPFQPTGQNFVEETYGRKEQGVGLGDRDISGQAGQGESGKQTGSSIAGGEGSDVGKSVAYSMQWGDGGTRRLLTGDLPAFPGGVDVEAQIKLEAIVMPGGRVKSLRPVQKGNTKLEEAAMRKVKGWLFEPLGGAAPQQEQVCVITFNFVLR